MTGLDQRAIAPATSLPRAVHRRRLLDALGRATERGSAVLSAPAGFGKTTLLEQWAAEAEGPPIAPLTVHRRDGGRQVAQRLVAALEVVGATISPDTHRLLGGEGRTLGDPFASSLVADLDSTGDVLLVVDGLDSPADPQLADELESLLRHLPAQIHVAVATRSQWSTDPHGSGSSLGRTPCHLGEDDLAFRPEEARQLVEEQADRCLTAEQLDALMARTRGWPVAVGVAAIAVRRATDVDAALRNLGGQDRYLKGYLDDEVLSRQPAVVREFLTRTSVLDRLSGPLCDAVTGRTDGAAMLRSAVRQGLYTRPEHPGGTWCTYHPLFRDHLRHELRHSRPRAESAYLGRAARWHLAGGDPEPAVRYLVEAGKWPELVAVIDDSGRQAFESGTIDRLSSWLTSVPGSRRPGRNDLLVRHAYLDTLLGETHRAGQALRDLDPAMLSPGEEAASEALRAMWVWWGAPERPAIVHADAALERLGSLGDGELPDILGLTSTASLRLIASGARARALWHLGDVAASRRSLALLVGRGDAYPPWSAQLQGALALLEAWAGNLRDAEEQARHALDVAARSGLSGHPVTVDALLALAHVARERVHPWRADGHLADVETIVGRGALPVTRAVHVIERSLGHLAAGHPERGLAEIDRHRARGDPPPPPLVSRRRRAVEARLLVAVGEAGRALDLVAADATGGAVEPAIVAAQAALAQGDLAAARTSLDHASTAGAEPGAVVEHRFWSAVVELQEGDRRRAVAGAAATLAHAEAEGYVRLLLDGGPPVERMLRELLRSKSTPYVLRLVTENTRPRRAASGHETGGLSMRELEVVRYLPTPLSSAEIADRLFIAVTTLKTHLQSIYRKLGVAGRREAAARAEELGLA